MEERQNQSERLGESEDEQKSFSEVIDAIIEAVDSENFPSSLDSNVGFNHIFEEGDLPIHEAFETPEGKADRDKFYKVHRKIDKLLPEVGEIEDVVNGMINAEQFFPAAVGFAAGLRAAGVSRRDACIMLSGYLRHFRKD